MQYSYILSNKENNCYLQRSPLRPKTNYQLRERNQRLKSPLGQKSNRRNYFGQNKDNYRESTRKRDLSFKYGEEPLTQPYSQMIYEGSYNRQFSDPSKIKPISMQSNGFRERENQKTLQTNNGENISLKNEYNTFSRSGHRQNSKHMGFVNKVNNLQKINHQITNLLSFVSQTKSNQKDQDLSNNVEYHKPHYADISQNSKSYQRRLNALEKPKSFEPQISDFSAHNLETSKPDDRNFNKQFSYEYKKRNQGNKTPGKVKNIEISIQMDRKTPKSTNKREISIKNVENQLNPHVNREISPLKTVKSQQFTQKLNLSDSNQQISKITTSNNLDLDFYYQSLKKRNQQIQTLNNNFQVSQSKKENSKVFQPTQNVNSLKKLNISSNNLTPKRANQINTKIDNNLKNLKQEQKQIQKDPFVTKEEIEIYKDINRLQRSNNQRIPSTKRIENLRAQINRSLNERTEDFLSNKTPKQYAANKRDRTMPNYELQAKKQSHVDTQSVKRMQNCKKQLALNSKIEDQIRKIQNELKDCKKQKSYLRQKYGNILTIQIPSQQQDAQQKQVKKCTYQEPQNSKNYDRNQDSERMYDSSFGKTNSNNMNHQISQTQEQFQKDLRNRMSFHNQRKKLKQPLGENPNDSKIYSQENINLIPQRRERRSNMANKGLTQKNSATEKLQTPMNGKKQKKFQIVLQEVAVTKPQTVKLGTLLAEKIQFDMKLRLKRQEFSKNKSPNKWEKVKSEMSSRYGVEKSSKQWQQLLTISSEEHNPFSPTQASSKPIGKLGQNSSSNSTDHQVSSLCELVTASLKHFQSHLLHKLSGQKLKKQHFSFRELDLTSKGYLSVEDVICFVNLQSGKFYRNRDIIFLLKSIVLFHKGQKNIEPFNSKAPSQHKFSYEFLWKVLTESS